MKEGDQVKVRKGKLRAGQVGVLTKFEYLPVLRADKWLVDFIDFSGSGYYAESELIIFKSKGGG